MVRGRTTIHAPKTAIGATIVGAIEARVARSDRLATPAITAAPTTPAIANGKRNTWVKKIARSSAERATLRAVVGRSTASSVTPTAPANSPSAPTKFRNAMWVSGPHTASSPNAPSSGLFFMPRSSTARPAGKSASSTAAASFVAATAGSTSISAAVTAKSAMYGTANGWRTNCSAKCQLGSPWCAKTADCAAWNGRSVIGG